MKKILSVILALLISLSVFSIAFAEENSRTGTIVYSREADVVQPIIISSDACSTDRTAAQKLQYYLKLCTGADYVITAEGDTGIFVGSAAAEKMDMSAVREDGYRIKAISGSVAIAGAGKRGTIYGVFAFLQEFCSCRWYAKQLIITPSSESISIPEDTDIVFNQTFEFRETDWISPRDKEYSLANQLNSGCYRHFEESEGGNINYVRGLAHTLTNEFCSSKKYFEDNPGLFALFEGERTGDQLCLSNEETYKIVRDEVMSTLEENVDKNDNDLHILSLTQNDNQHYCQCEKCAASDEKYGSHSGSLLLFINRIAQEVEEAGYSNVVVDTFAYQYTRKPPVGIVPRENVIVRLCSIECCFCHPLDDPDCKLNSDFMKDLQEWNKICSRLYIWDYTTNYARTLIAFSDFGVIQKNMQIFAENGVKGIYEEGAYYAERCNCEFADLRSYLLSRLLIDPYMDYEKEMSGFLRAYYGGAAKYIKEYIDILEKSESENDHMPIYDGADELYQSLKKKDITYINRLWISAERAAETDFQKANVRRSELSWLAWKAENKVGEFSRLHLPSVWMGANEKFYDRLLEENVTMMSEGSDYLMTDPEQRNYIIASNPYFWKISKLENEDLLREYNKKYDMYVTIEKYFGPVLKPVLELLFLIFGK